MLRFTDIKFFATSLERKIPRNDKVFTEPECLVFEAGYELLPYDDVLKSDSILEIFYPAGLEPFSRWLLEKYGKNIPKYCLETMTFSHLLDIVNGIPDDRHHGKEQQIAPTEAEWLESGYANPLWCKDYLHKKGRDIMMKKNHDYTGGSGDPYENFNGSVEFGVAPVVGILLRVQDKMKRIQTFVDKGELKVQGESVEDALIDVQNYMDLIFGIIKGKRDESK